jgi:membrane protease YdiL (CAAX protease family)
MAAFLALLMAYVAVRAFWLIGSQPWPILDAAWVEQGLLKVALWVVPCLLALAVATRQRLSRVAMTVGLLGSARAGYLFGLVATAPMAVAVLAAWPPSATLDAVAGSAVLGPFAEEVLFRGVLFTALVRYAGWRPASAMVVSAVAFALAHHQGTSVTVATGAGALLFDDGLRWMGDFFDALMSLMPFVGAGLLLAWTTHRWESLWPAIGLHTCINFWWELAPGTYDMASITRTTMTSMPVAHGLAIVLAVVITLRATGRKGVGQFWRVSGTRSTAASS